MPMSRWCQDVWSYVDSMGVTKIPGEAVRDMRSCF